MPSTAPPLPCETHPAQRPSINPVEKGLLLLRGTVIVVHCLLKGPHQSYLGYFPADELYTIPDFTLINQSYLGYFPADELYTIPNFTIIIY